jgi:hypothetical protein
VSDELPQFFMDEGKLAKGEIVFASKHAPTASEEILEAIVLRAVDDAQVSHAYGSDRAQER